MHCISHYIKKYKVVIVLQTFCKCPNHSSIFTKITARCHVNFQSNKNYIHQRPNLCQTSPNPSTNSSLCPPPPSVQCLKPPPDPNAPIWPFPLHTATPPDWQHPLPLSIWCWMSLDNISICYGIHLSTFFTVTPEPYRGITR